jgi:hypothetical protein
LVSFTRDDLSFATGDDLSFALIPGAAKLDATGGIVNMFQPYPALHRVPLPPGCDDVR